MAKRHQLSNNFALKKVYLGKYKIPQLTMLKKFVLVLEAWEDRTFLDCTKVIEAAPQLTEFELNLFGMLAGFPPEWNPDSGISFDEYHNRGYEDEDFNYVFGTHGMCLALGSSLVSQPNDLWNILENERCSGAEV
ncbi:hypothetical protein KY285_022186 [Solanum tuberosum]|nr:hypothetical protein KY285_022186 [Solanum tuberosum]